MREGRGGAGGAAAGGEVELRRDTGWWEVHPGKRSGRISVRAKEAYKLYENIIEAYKLYGNIIEGFCTMLFICKECQIGF